MNRLPSAQRGFLLIVAVVLIVIVGLLAAVITVLTTGNVLTSASHANSAKALFVAESGLERAILGYKTGTFCTSLSTLTPPSAVGEGDFSITGAFNIASVALGANITTTDSVITVGSTAGFASHGRIRIENEDIDYAAITATTFTGARRGVAGSTAAAHNTGAAVNVAQDECVIRSTGIVTAGNARRAVEKGLQNPGAMMVYAQAAGNNIPFFRRWDGTRWGPQRQATPLTVGTTIQYLLLKFARTRNEAILGTMDNAGRIQVQVWNGVSWGAVTTLATVGAGNDNYRGFDIEYETAGDRAIVVYNNANNRNPAYRIWNGTAWSAAVALNTELGFVYPTAGAPVWIELAPNPLANSNEMALITLDNNHDVYGARWTGTAWSGMAVAATWDNSAANNCPGAINPCKVIDVAYEQLSGRAMFIWGDNANGMQRYRIWTGAALTAIAPLDLNPVAGPNGEANWVRLVARPNSNELLCGVQDENRDLFTARWNGAAWSAQIRHTDRVEDDQDRSFDIVFETHPSATGRAWLVYGRRGGGGGTAGVNYRQWNGAAWGATTAVGGRTALVQLATQPYTGAVFAAIYEDTAAANDDIREMHTTGGGGWSVLSNPTTTPTDPVWAGPTVGNPVMERVFVATERYVPIVDWREIFP